MPVPFFDRLACKAGQSTGGREMRYLLLLGLRKPKANVLDFPGDPPGHGLFGGTERAQRVRFRPPQGQASEQQRVPDSWDWKKRAMSLQPRSTGTDLGVWDSGPSEGAYVLFLV